jgi:hypothetical protein
VVRVVTVLGRRTAKWARAAERSGKGEAMTEPVRRAFGALVLVIVVAGVAACGGASKPPMVPDAPDPAVTGDAGADTPTTAPPAGKK